MTRQVSPDEDRWTEQFLGTQAEAEWQRLRRQIDLSPGFWLGFLFADSPRVTNIFAARLAAVYRSHARHIRTLWAETPDEIAGILEQLFAPDVRAADAIWVSAIRDLASDRRQAWAAAWQAFFLRLNERRERPELSSGPLGQIATGRLREVEGLLTLDQPRKAIDLAVQTVDLLTQADEQHPLLIDALSALARAEAADGDDAAALDHYRRVLQLAGDSDNRELLSWLDAAAEVARNVGRVELVEAFVLRQKAVSRRRLQQYGESPQTLRDVSVSLDRVGDVRRASGDLSGAEGAFAESLEISRRLLQQYGESPQALRDVSVSLNKEIGRASCRERV